MLVLPRLVLDSFACPHHCHQNDRLYQLVSFAQVVLLIIKENVREEEQDTLGKDDIQPPTLTKDNKKVTIVTIPQTALSTASSITLLTTIGEIFIKF